MNSLTNEILTKIFDFLDLSSLKTCEKVSATWSKFVRNYLKNVSSIDHPQPSVPHTNWCPFHQIQYKSPSIFKTHMKDKHKINIDNSTPGLFCAICASEFFYNFQRIHHLVKVHNVKIDEIRLTFPSIDEFSRWKGDEEKETKSYFSKTSSSTNIIYSCNRNPVSSDKKRNLEEREFGKRNIKSVGYR